MKLTSFCITVWTAVCLFGLVESAGAWGFQAHKLINGQAIRMVPPPLQTFFRNNLRFVREHSIDPDLWRQAGQEPEADHFFEVDSFAGLRLEHWPADEPAFLRTFGSAAVQSGRLPWRIMEVYRKLIEQLRKDNWVEARLQAAALGHYVADAYVPFHATKNYDGQLTGNLGIHARWETQLVERFEQQIRQQLETKPVELVRPTPEAVVRVLFDGLAACSRILENDSRSVGGQVNSREPATDERHSDDYYSRLYALEETDLVRRIQDSATRIAEIWYSAWVEAARPSFPKGKQGNSVSKLAGPHFTALSSIPPRIQSLVTIP